MKKAVYAGTFDPPTNGHLWMIKKGSKLFDELVVAIGANQGKICTFSLDERIAMLQKITSSFSNVSVDNFESQFLVDYAKSVKADYILRGIRTERDFVHECGIRHINSDLSPEVTTVFLIPPREIVEVSSSFVKELVGPEGWQEVIKKYVPGPVHKKFLEKFAAATK